MRIIVLSLGILITSLGLIGWASIVYYPTTISDIFNLDKIVELVIYSIITSIGSMIVIYEYRKS